MGRFEEDEDDENDDNDDDENDDVLKLKLKWTDVTCGPVTKGPDYHPTSDTRDIAVITTVVGARLHGCGGEW